VVYDTSAETLAKAKEQTGAFFKRSVERGRLKPEQLPVVMANLVGTTTIADMAACDLVIEAVFEDLAVKHALLAQLDAACPPHPIFASNTSPLSITEIAGGSGRPDRFVGMHFCLPAQLMKLVEMSPGLVTSDATFEAAWKTCVAMGQQPVKTKDN